MAEKTVTLPSDAGNTGKAMRTVENTVGTALVDQEVVTLADSAGNLLDTQLSNLNITLSALRDAITAALQATQPRTVTNTVTVDDSLTLQTLIDVQRDVLSQLSLLTLMFGAVFSPNADLGGLMAKSLAPVTTN